MYFTELTPHEFQSFVTQNFSHYTQDINHFNYRDKHRKDSYLLGVKNETNEVLAACLLTEARCLRYYKYFYTHRGPVMDYTDLNLVRFFFDNLYKYLKKLNGIFVLVDPYILKSIRNAKGQIKLEYDNLLLFNTLHCLGYRHLGDTIGYSNTSQIRWLSVLDLANKTEEQLLQDMDYQTRRNIKKTYDMGIQVKTLPIEETETFFKLFQMAEEKHGFKFRELDYFKAMQRTYGERAMLKLAYIDLNHYLKTLSLKQRDLQQSLDDINQILRDNPNSKKSKTKHTQLQQQLTSVTRKIEQTKQEINTEGTKLHLAAALFIHNNHEIYYLSSGSNPQFNAYMGAYRLQWEMIKFAKAHHIERYNFYGITGDFSEQAEDAGVQQFKKGFNAHVEEYVGDFIKPIRPGLYKLFKLLNKGMF